jgi:hypothetical protein
VTSRRRIGPAADGFTLVELMIGLVLLLAVGGVAFRLVAVSQRVTRAQLQRVAMQDHARSGALLLANELRELGYDEVTPAALARFPGAALPAGPNPDLLALGPDSITYRGMRALGFTCAVSAVSGMVLRNSAAVPLIAVRPIAVTDSLLLFVEGDPAVTEDDLWLTAGLAAAPDPSPCPDGTAGVRLRFALPPGLGIAPADLAANLTVGSPVRAFEVTQLRSYRSGGRLWLGLRVRPGTGPAIEPLVGPLSDGAGPARGFLLGYRDAAGASTGVANDVRRVELTLKVVSDELVRSAGTTAAVDTLALGGGVALRNALRP